MVEFALVIPLFLVLVFGVLEFGRLLFVYSAVFTASREAARYGAAVGIGPNGRPYFQDCRGMRDAAIRIGNLAGLQDGDISISYDNPDTGKSGINCNDQTSPVTPSNDQIELGDRVVVTVQITYEPIVGFLGLPDFPIRSTSRRTIVRDVRLDEAISMPVPSQTINPSAAPGLTQTAYSIATSVAQTQTSVALTATAEAGTPEPACPPPGTFKVPEEKNGKYFQFSITNPAANTGVVRIETMTIGWENPGSPVKKLVSIKLGSNSIWSGNDQSVPVVIDTWSGTSTAREIGSGESKVLVFTFDKKLEASNINKWWVSIQFSGACNGIVTWTGTK